MPSLAASLHDFLREQLSSRFIRNLASMGGAQLAIRISRLVTTVVLARYLSATDYGLAAIVLTVYEVVALFTRNGIAASVVRAGEADLATVAQTAYRLIWIACGALVVLQVLAALPLAWLYHDDGLALPIALMGLIYIATPLCAIQGAFMQREHRLGRTALTGCAQLIADNILTLGFAAGGLGMWAIVLPKLLVAPIWVIGIRYGHAWRPTHDWSLTGWREIVRFSRHVVGIEMMTTMQANMDNLIVGAFLGVQALGLYYFAFNAGLGITLGLITSFAMAAFPHLCEARGNRIQLLARYRHSLATVGGIVVPLVLLQAALAPVYVPFVFGAKWAPAVPVLVLICLSALPRPFAMICSQLLRAVGRPDIELRWQTALTLLLATALLAGTRFGIVGVAAAVLAVQGIVLTAYVLRTSQQVFGSCREICVGGLQNV